MPTAKTTVNIAAEDTAGNPLAYRAIYVTLHAGTQGGTVDGDTTVVSPVIVRTDADGEAAVALYPNSAITPANSWYSLVVDQSKPTVVRTIRVPASGPVDWSDDAIQVDPIELGGVVPAVATGDPLDVLRIDATGTAAEWAAPSSGSGTSAKIVAAGAVLATEAVDGTSDRFQFLSRDLDATASDIIPAGWVAFGAETDAAGAAAFIGGLPGDTLNVFVPDEGKAYTLTPTNLDEPWVDLEATVVEWTDFTGQRSAFDLDGTGAYVAREARSIPNPDGAIGLLADVNPNVGEQIGNLEGIADRPRFVSAVATTNVNLAALGSATFEYGALRFEAPANECNIWLMGQTTPSQNGHYKVSSGFTATKITNPSTFDPPGQGAPLWLVNPGDPHHGAEWRWFDEDPTRNMRAVGDSTGAVGAWVLQHDPTASGGAVDSVNGDTGTVVLNAADVGAPALSTLTTKGDTWVATGSGTVARLGVGSDGQVPIANANETTGTAWAFPASTHLFNSGAYTANAPYVSSTLALTNDRLYLCKPFIIRKRRTFSRIAVNHISGTSSTGSIRIGLYVPTDADGLPTTLLTEYGTVSATSAAAVKPVTTTFTLEPGIYFPAVVGQFTGTAPTLAAVGNGTPPIYPDPYTIGAGNTMPIQASVSGAMPSTLTISSSVNTSPVVYLYV